MWGVTSIHFTSLANLHLWTLGFDLQPMNDLKDHESFLVIPSILGVGITPSASVPATAPNLVGISGVSQVHSFCTSWEG